MKIFETCEKQILDCSNMWPGAHLLANHHSSQVQQDLHQHVQCCPNFEHYYQDRRGLGRGGKTMVKSLRPDIITACGGKTYNQSPKRG